MASGAPTEAQVKAVWQNVVDLLETTRAWLDGTLVVQDGTGLLDVLEQSLIGDYLPNDLSALAAQFRALGSAMVDPGLVLSMLSPIVLEYTKVISETPGAGDAAGIGSNDLGELWSALYRFYDQTSRTVQSRNITFSSSDTGTSTGDGTMKRITVDAKGYDREACHVEKKVFRCVADQNSGTDEHAEIFEVVGEPQSPDALLRAASTGPSSARQGSGDSIRTRIRSKHAGTGEGGSLVTNASFSDYTSSSTSGEQFSGWTETLSGGATYDDITQDTTTYFRTHPGATTDASLKIAQGGAGETTTLAQTIAASRISGGFNVNVPILCSIMVNASAGSATDGTVNIRLGSQTVAQLVSGLGAGWNEVLLSLGSGCYLENFNEDGFTVEIELTACTGGYVLFDDFIVAQMDFIDGTFWAIRGGATPWLFDDTLIFTDTGGAPTTGQIQWWNWVSGLGYLPSTTGTPTLADPS